MCLLWAMALWWFQYVRPKARDFEVQERLTIISLKSHECKQIAKSFELKYLSQLLLCISLRRCETTNSSVYRRPPVSGKFPPKNSWDDIRWGPAFTRRRSSSRVNLRFRMKVSWPAQCKCLKLPYPGRRARYTPGDQGPAAYTDLASFTTRMALAVEILLLYPQFKYLIGPHIMERTVKQPEV